MRDEGAYYLRQKQRENLLLAVLPSLETLLAAAHPTKVRADWQQSKIEHEDLGEYEEHEAKKATKGMQQEGISANRPLGRALLFVAFVAFSSFLSLVFTFFDASDVPTGSLP